MGYNLYVYKEEDLYLEELYFKSRLLDFCNELGSSYGNLRNQPKKCIQTCWLVYAKSKEERKRIFGKWS